MIFSDFFRSDSKFVPAALLNDESDQDPANFDALFCIIIAQFS